MARPKKQLPPPKDHQLTIRFTKDLYDVLTADAAAAGLPRTEYIRQLITNRNPVIKQEIVFDDPEILQIFPQCHVHSPQLHGKGTPGFL